jgi:hypothetical protein
MEKAFDVAVLADKLKARGLDVAEDAAKAIVEETVAWVKASVALTENKFDDFFMVIEPMLMPELAKQVDKIDGKEG